MNKSLVVVLALVLVVVFAGTAFAAANPFVDVPKGHWAYDAVTKLAQDGILTGDSATTLNGNKVVTRYEMAKVVANAVSKMDKANAEDQAVIEKLSREFAEELANLNVRVTNLEQKADKIRMGAFAMLKYDNRAWPSTNSTKSVANVIRGGFKFVSFINYQLADGWNLQTAGEFTRDMQNGDNTMGNRDNLKTCDINGKIDGVTVHLGKYHYMDSASGFVFSDEVSGVGLTFGNKFKITTNYGWMNNAYNLNNPGFSDDPIYVDPNATFPDVWYSKGPKYRSVDVSYPLSKVTNVAYIYHYLSNKDYSPISRHISEYGFDTKLNKDLTFKVAGSNTSWDTDNKGWFFGLSYGRADFFRPGSWEAYLNYSRTDKTASIANFYDCEDALYGAKGVTVGGTITLRPKIQLETKYINMFGTREGHENWHDKFFRIQLNLMLM